ncbi:hypothetical protein J6590_053089 [Homalodisca vitripennis]|nr:hypothetical protein J6590_053089 [Homalodisca vitripennis]
MKRIVERLKKLGFPPEEIVQCPMVLKSSSTSIDHYVKILEESGVSYDNIKLELITRAKFLKLMKMPTSELKAKGLIEKDIDVKRNILHYTDLPSSIHVPETDDSQRLDMIQAGDDHQTCIQRENSILTEQSPYLSAGTSTCQQNFPGCPTIQNAKSSKQERSPTTQKRVCTPQSTRRRKINMFSVSLQVAKAAERSSALGPQKPANLENKMKLSNAPPLNSKLRRNGEDYEDFFLKHIAFYLEHLTKHYGYKEKENQNSAHPTQIPQHNFLDQQPQSKERHKIQL